MSGGALWTPAEPKLEIPQLSTDQLAALEWRFTPAGFAERLTGGRYSRPRHVQLIASHYALLVAGQIDRLLISLPPRHSKSETTSKWGSAWALDLHPEWRILLGSYQDTFASEWGFKVRSLLEEHKEHLQVRVSPDFGARNAWFTTEGGGMFTSGAGGAFTGRGGDVFVIDDPFKNFAEAHSIVIRDKVWDWYTGTAYSRLEPQGRIVVVSTRWHEDDLIGRLLKAQEEGGDQWTYLRLPAIAEDDDLLGRPAGAALWPERYNEEALHRIERAVGSYVWASQYQQRPSPPKGGIFRRGWWRYYWEPPNPSRVSEWLISWDMAFKDAEDSSYVVGQVWCSEGGDKYLIDQVRDHLSFTETLTAVRSLAAAYPHVRLHLVEDKANGPAVIQSLGRTISGMVPVSPRDSKIARAHAVTPDIEAGNVWLPDPSLKRWVHDFVEETAAFPKGATDDQVDAMTQALERLHAWAPELASRYSDQRLAGRR